MFALHVLTKDLPMKSYGNRLISTQNRLSRRAINAAGLFLDIVRQTLINLTIFVLHVCKIFTSEQLLKATYIDKKIDATGEPLVPRAYFLISFDRTRYTKQFLFYMSLQNCYQ